MEQQHGEFSFPVDRHTCTTHTHTHTHRHTFMSTTADSAEQSSFPVTKALEVWKQLLQSFCCLSQTHTSTPCTSSSFLSPVPPSSLFCSHSNSTHLLDFWDFHWKQYCQSSCIKCKFPAAQTVYTFRPCQDDKLLSFSQTTENVCGPLPPSPQSLSVCLHPSLTYRRMHILSFKHTPLLPSHTVYCSSHAWSNIHGDSLSYIRLLLAVLFCLCNLPLYK